MTLPIWQTPAGALGTHPTSDVVNIQLYAVPLFPGTLLAYKFLSGELPIGLSLTSDGFLVGTIGMVSEQTDYNFTIRITDEFGSFRDRSFSITVVQANNPKFLTPEGIILVTNDSTYVNYSIQYSNPDPTNVVTITKSSGILPDGLYLTNDGTIKGYALPPYTSNRSPTETTFQFTLQIHSKLGNAVATYSISVINQLVLSPVNSRVPVILNSEPLTEPLVSDQYYAYYTTDNNIPITRGNENFSFKVLGHDFDGSGLLYQFGALPEGLVGDPATGWITGSPVMPAESINKFVFDVVVVKLSNTAINSGRQTFSIILSNNIPEDIVWNTPSDLGTILNGADSLFTISATSSRYLEYFIDSGSLPPNLELLPSGEIVGRVSFQPEKSYVTVGTKTAYNFRVHAFSPEFTLLSTYQDFTITVEHYFDKPTENIYLKAAPNIAGRKLIQSLLVGNLIPDEYLFRPNDPNFGKAKDVRYIHAYGMTPSTAVEYINAISQNHYNRKIILGPLQTAVASDSNGNILYEVVYSPIIDDLITKDNTTLPQTILLEQPASLQEGPWTVSSGEIFASYSHNADGMFYTSLTPGYVNELYPGSLINMRKQVTDVIGQNTDRKLLPLWMTTQQTGINTLGFVQAWVLCYTLPNCASIVKNNIEQNWGHTLNEIDFSVDRYLIDKSATYNYNVNLSKPQWTEIPGDSPLPIPSDQYDMTILFPRKTILPKNID